jgi:hypothetical protein
MIIVFVGPICYVAQKSHTDDLSQPNQVANCGARGLKINPVVLAPSVPHVAWHPYISVELGSAICGPHGARHFGTSR